VDASTIYLVTRFSGSVAGDIDKSALSGLSISINHYNDPRAHSRQGSKYRRKLRTRDVYHSVISRDLGPPVIIKLLSSLRKVSDTIRVPLRHTSRPSRSFISSVAPCRECRREDIGPWTCLSSTDLKPPDSFPAVNNLLLKRQPAGIRTTVYFDDYLTLNKMVDKNGK